MNLSKELLDQFRRFIMAKYHEACDRVTFETKHRNRQRYSSSPHYQRSVETKIMLAIRERDKWFAFTQEFRSQTFTHLKINQIFERAGQDEMVKMTRIVKTDRSAVFSLKRDPRREAIETTSRALEAFLKDEELDDE